MNRVVLCSMQSTTRRRRSALTVAPVEQMSTIMSASSGGRASVAPSFCKLHLRVPEVMLETDGSLRLMRRRQTLRSCWPRNRPRGPMR